MSDLATATTQQVPTLDRTSAPPRGSRITDDRILEEYGGLIWSALVAFGTDITYLTEMVEAANRRDEKISARDETIRTRATCREATCELCGEAFTTTHPRRRFCTKRCVGMASARSKRARERS